MTATAAAAEAITAARSAVAGDVADVTAAIDTATTTIDQQLESLHEHRQVLEEALADVNEQIAMVDAYREALVSARASVASDIDDGQLRAAMERARSQDQHQVDDEGDGEPFYLEFTEDELDPDLSRSTRIVTILERAQQELNAADIAAILNEFGDDTTTKVVGGTLSNLVRRNVVTKVAPGVYATA